MGAIERRVSKVENNESFIGLGGAELSSPCRARDFPSLAFPSPSRPSHPAKCLWSVVIIIVGGI